jgi:peptidoglycan lytic transglycosylase
MTDRGVSVIGADPSAGSRKAGGGCDRPRVAVRGAVAVSLLCALAACNTTSSSSNKYGVTASPRVVPFGQPVPDGGGYYKVGRPYKVAGEWYHPKEDVGYDKTGRASWYGSDFHGRRTANGEIYDMGGLSAAHPTLPLPTYARVTNLENGRSVVVRINDRGPFAHDRLIDVSKRTAEVLDFHHDGTANVRVQYVGMAPLEGKDGQWLTTTVRSDGEAVGPVMMASLAVPEPQQQNGYVQPPPPPPAGTPSPDPQQAVAFTPTTYTGTVTPAPEPVSAAFAPEIDGPTPKVPVGTGKVTYRWVSGYVGGNANTLVSQAFSAFDGNRETVIVIVDRAPAHGAKTVYR